MEKREHINVLTMASYGMGKYLAEFLTGAFGAVVYKFYETEIGLAPLYAALATILYSVWNAVNDPLIGYLTNKGAPFSSKLGRRFPWIIIGLVISAASFLLIFSVPSSFIEEVRSNPFPVFLWMVVTICLFDTSYSLWELNYQSVFPDKFRSQSIRAKSAGISTAVGVLGIASGFVIPPLFFSYGDIGSYKVAAYVIAGITLAGILLILNGVKETDEMIGRFMSHKEDKKGEGTGFVQLLKRVLKHKDLTAFLILLFLYQSATMCMTSSVHYVADYILEVESSGTTLIFAGMLAGTLLSIPVWLTLSKKGVNNQSMLSITAVVMALFAFPMTFLTTINAFSLFMALWGIGFGGFWTFMGPAMADIVDEIVVMERRRDDGVLMGVRAFFMRFSYASQALVFYIVHELTGFDPEAVTPLAKTGIALHMAAVPALFLLLGALIFIRMNTLDEKRIAENKEILATLDI